MFAVHVPPLLHALLVLVGPPRTPDPCRFIADSALLTAFCIEAPPLAQFKEMLNVLLVGEMGNVLVVENAQPSIDPVWTLGAAPGREILVVCPAAAAATAAVPWVIN